MSDIIDRRYEFVVLFDVENGNPNGDPDADNMPRIAETRQSIVTMFVLRKIRDYVSIVKECTGYIMLEAMLFTFTK